MRINKVEIELKVGDITKQPDIVAIVNAANAELKIGGGVAGAIHRTAGPELARECQQFAPIKPGEAVITRAYELSNDHVIHCLGPVYGVDHPESTLLANCYQNSLKLAEENNIDSIAFPAISTGVFGYPIEEATEVVFSVINRVTRSVVNLRKIRFVLYSQSDFEVYQRRFQNTPRGDHE